MKKCPYRCRLTSRKDLIMLFRVRRIALEVRIAKESSYSFVIAQA